MISLLLATLLFADGLPGRTPPEWSFSLSPRVLMFSYYDYMIGSYHNYPLQVHPSGGYVAVYHGMTGATATRRVFFSRLNDTGDLIQNNYVDEYNPNREGYPALAIDPASGALIYAWHEDFDTDDRLEIRLTADLFSNGYPGSFALSQTVVDNPISITSPEGIINADNEFAWPSLVIGPSPLAGKNRIYLLSRNVQLIDPARCTNVYLAYADFDLNDLQPGNQLVWNYRSIPLLDTYYNDPLFGRSINLALTCDNSGKIYICGNHYTYRDADSAIIPEPDIDIFSCGDYGSGAWQDLHFSSDLPSWNPNSAPADSTGFFKTDEGLPYGDGMLSWRILNSTHFNISRDAWGRVHIPALWFFSDGNAYHSNGYRELNYVKDAIFDPFTEQLEIEEVYPQKDPSDDFNSSYQPWDRQEPWGEEDGWIQTNSAFQPDIAKDWNFCDWNEDGHTEAMMFHYNFIRVTHANAQGMMAMLWQNSLKARNYHYYNDAAYSAYIDAPEIMISVSSDNGNSWSEPIVLSSVNCPELAGILPQWVYCADQIIYSGEVDGHRIGKLGLFFYDDESWWLNEFSPPIPVTNYGGNVMFAELQITFPLPVGVSDSAQTPPGNCISAIYPNPFTTGTSFEINLAKAGKLDLEIFNLRGQKVKSLFSGLSERGKLSLSWDATDEQGQRVGSGIYLLCLRQEGRQEIRKMMLH